MTEPELCIAEEDELLAYVNAKTANKSFIESASQGTVGDVVQVRCRATTLAALS